MHHFVVRSTSSSLRLCIQSQQQLAEFLQNDSEVCEIFPPAPAQLPPPAPSRGHGLGSTLSSCALHCCSFFCFLFPLAALLAPVAVAIYMIVLFGTSNEAQVITLLSIQVVWLIWGCACSGFLSLVLLPQHTTGAQLALFAGELEMRVSSSHLVTPKRRIPLHCIRRFQPAQQNAPGTGGSEEGGERVTNKTVGIEVISTGWPMIIGPIASEQACLEVSEELNEALEIFRSRTEQPVELQVFPESDSRQEQKEMLSQSTSLMSEHTGETSFSISRNSRGLLICKRLGPRWSLASIYFTLMTLQLVLTVTMTTFVPPKRTHWSAGFIVVVATLTCLWGFPMQVLVGAWLKGEQWTFGKDYISKRRKYRLLPFRRRRYSISEIEKIVLVLNSVSNFDRMRADCLSMSVATQGHERYEIRFESRSGEAPCRIKQMTEGDIAHICHLLRIEYPQLIPS